MNWNPVLESLSWCWFRKYSLPWERVVVAHPHLDYFIGQNTAKPPHWSNLNLSRDWLPLVFPHIAEEPLALVHVSFLLREVTSQPHLRPISQQKKSVWQIAEKPACVGPHLGTPSPLQSLGTEIVMWEEIVGPECLGCDGSQRVENGCWCFESSMDLPTQVLLMEQYKPRGSGNAYVLINVKRLDNNYFSNHHEHLKTNGPSLSFQDCIGLQVSYTRTSQTIMCIWIAWVSC